MRKALFLWFHHVSSIPCASNEKISSGDLKSQVDMFHVGPRSFEPQMFGVTFANIGTISSKSSGGLCSMFFGIRNVEDHQNHPTKFWVNPT